MTFDANPDCLGALWRVSGPERVERRPPRGSGLKPPETDFSKEPIALETHRT